MTDSMVERVALALCNHHYGEDTEFQDVKGVDGWSVLLSEKGKDAWRKQARAAIAAIREPTGKMVEAAVNKYENNDPNEYCSASGFQDGWNAAIDEALKS